MKVIVKKFYNRAKSAPFSLFIRWFWVKNDIHCPFIGWNGAIFAVTRDVKDFNFTLWIQAFSEFEGYQI